MDYLWVSCTNQEVPEVPEGFRVFRRVGESKEQGGSMILWSKCEVAARVEWGERGGGAGRERMRREIGRGRGPLYRPTAQGWMIRYRAGSSGGFQSRFSTGCRIIRVRAGSSGDHRNFLADSLEMMSFDPMWKIRVWTYKNLDSNMISHNQYYITMIIWGKEWSNNHNIKYLKKNSHK